MLMNGYQRFSSFIDIKDSVVLWLQVPPTSKIHKEKLCYLWCRPNTLCDEFISVIQSIYASKANAGHSIYAYEFMVCTKLPFLYSHLWIYEWTSIINWAIILNTIRQMIYVTYTMSTRLDKLANWKKYAKSKPNIPFYLCFDDIMSTHKCDLLSVIMQKEKANLVEVN